MAELKPSRLTGGLKPGWYEGVTAGEYHKWSLVSASKLQKLYAKTAEHLRYELTHQSEEEEGDKPIGVSDSLGFGTVIHMAVLEPERFLTRYFRCPDGMRLNTAKGIAEYGELRLRHPAKKGVKADAWDAAISIGKKLRNRVGTRAILESTKFFETSFIAKDEETGFHYKGRPDGVSLELGATIDLKTCQSAELRSFSASAYRFGYFRQGALYVKGMASVTGGAIRDHIIIAVEKEAPYAAMVGTVSARELEASTKENSELLKLYAKCEETGEWPGYPETMQDLQRSEYQFREHERGVGLEINENGGDEPWMTSQLQ